MYTISRKMDVIMFVALHLFIHSPVAKAKQTKLACYHLLKDKNITAAVIAKSKENDATGCARSCVHSDICQSFFYNTKTGECQYHEALFTSPTGATDQEGLEYYYIIRGRDDWCPVAKDFQLIPEGDHCVKFHLDKKTWYGANQTCVSYSPNSRLVVVDNQEKNDLVKTAGIAINDQFRDGVWIGLLEESNDVFRWVNGGDVDFSEWGSGLWTVEDREDCAYFRRGDSWRWAKGACSKKYHYVCEIVVDIYYHQMMDNKR